MGVPDVPGTHAATCKARMVVSNQPGGAYPKGLLTAGAALMYIPVLLVGPRAAVCLSLALWKVELEAAGQGTERNSCLDEKLVRLRAMFASHRIAHDRKEEKIC